MSNTNWPPNDQFWQEQIQLHSSNYNIDLPKAWSYSDGNSGIKIGIFDDGVNYNHVDLSQGFGYGHRVRGGYDFFQNDSDPINNTDEDYHGTKVAGVIGALNNNNSIGVIGIAGGWQTVISGCQLFAFRVGGTVPEIGHVISMSDLIEAIIEAASDPTINNGFGYGIDLMNFSLGKYQSQLYGNEEIDLYYAIVFSYFNNVAMASSKGNDGSSVPFYPANWSKAKILFSVSGVDNDGFIHQNSNYGDGVTIAAPWYSGKTTSTSPLYDEFTGTSNAAPFVTGTAALIYSKFLERGLTVLNDDAIQIVKLSAIPKNDPLHYGSGLLNTGEALRLANDYNLIHAVANINRTVTTVSNPPGNQLSMYYPFAQFIVSETKKIRGTVRIPDSFKLEKTWTWANSYSEGYEWGNPSYGIPFATKVSQNGRDVLYEMYCYKMMPVGGSTLSWWPVDPNSADINVSIFGEPAPLHVTISGPTSAQQGSTSNFTSEVTGAQGNVTYQWEQMYQCCTDEMECGVYGYRGNNSTLSISNTSQFHYFLRLTVWDGLNRSASDVHYVTVETCDPVGGGGGGGCPTLAFDSDTTSDSGTEDENPLLITSTSYPSEDVVDYYLIQSEIAPIDGEIHFNIREPETEHTWLDQVELIEVELNDAELLAVTDNGEVVNYLEPVSPVTIILNDSIDVTDSLSDADGNTLNVTPGDILSIEVIENQLDQNIFIILEGLVNTKLITADVSFTSNGTDYEDLGDIFLRPNLSIASINLGSLGAGTLKVLFYRDGTMDYLTLVSDLNTAEIETLEMTSAEHSELGNVLELLVGDPDQQYAEIYPGQEIAFAFREGQHTLPRIEYVLKTIGRYETDTTDASQRLAKTTEEVIIPKENKLYDNYPNPFNPTTQIKFAVKEDGLVSLKVYDVLGKEVAGLVNEEKQAGEYTATFDADRLSSGIYFYTITAKDFQQSKKMLLIK